MPKAFDFQNRATNDFLACGKGKSTPENWFFCVFTQPRSGAAGQVAEIAWSSAMRIGGQLLAISHQEPTQPVMEQSMPQSPLESRLVTQPVPEQVNLPEVSQPASCYAIRGGLTKVILRAAEDYDGGLVLKWRYKLGGYFRNRPD